MDRFLCSNVNMLNLTIELIQMGARLQIVASETKLNRGRLIKLYKELTGASPPKGLLPFSNEWFIKWENNIHSSIFYNAYLFLLMMAGEDHLTSLIKAFKLYLDECKNLPEDTPLLNITRAWTLVRFVEKKLLQLTACKSCKGMFITHAYLPSCGFECNFCSPPSRAIKKDSSSHW